nr:replication initiation factor domain-containing protein [Staphylococcus sp. MZ8]
MARLFKRCAIKKARFTRIDIAIDDTKTYLKIPILIKKAEHGECISKFRTASSISGFKLSDGQSKGSTFYIGSKKVICIVDFTKRIMKWHINLKYLLKILDYGIVMKYKCDEVMRKIVH